MLGSLFAGIAFSHARLGDVHAMSHPVSAFFDIPHGVANAILLPKVVEFNSASTKELDMLEKFYQIYRCVCKNPVSKAEFLPNMLSAELSSLNAELEIPNNLEKAGVEKNAFENVIQKMADDAMKSGNINVNPRETKREDILKRYRKSFSED